MNIQNLKEQWLAEEQIAHIHGWDFSHLSGRMDEETDFPWDYRDVIGQYLQPELRILDLDTGGGEFLLSLGHPHANTAATEHYPPNVALCRETLMPLGVDFRDADAAGPLPFPDESFDLILNRHGDFNPSELYRILKPGGYFITQQVGAENDRELVDLLLPGTPISFPGQQLAPVCTRFRDAGFEIVRADEARRALTFYDVGAAVWFARIIEWEFPGFSVESCLDRLIDAQKLLEQQGYLRCSTHRFLIVARKP